MEKKTIKLVINERKLAEHNRAIEQAATLAKYIEDRLALVRKEAEKLVEAQKKLLDLAENNPAEFITYAEVLELSQEVYKHSLAYHTGGAIAHISATNANSAYWSNVIANSNVRG